MSIICHLVIFLLYLCFYACDARQLGVIDKDVAERFQLPNQNNESSSSLVRVLDPSKEQQSAPSSKFDHDDEAIKDNIHKEMIKKTSKKPIIERGHGIIKSSSSSNISQTKPLNFVSWKVPHKKKREQQPGFNLDYSPPKTHPPVHN